MASNQDSPSLKNISILDERPIPTCKKRITLIYNDLLAQQCIEIETERATKFEKLITFMIDDTIAAKLTPISNFTSTRAVARNLKNVILNQYLKLAKPIKASSVVFDTRDTEPNNMAHLMIQIIPLCLHAKNTSKLDVQFIFSKVYQPFLQLLQAFEIKTIFTSRKIQGTFLKVRATRGLAAYEASNVFDCPATTFISGTYDNYKFSSGMQNMDKIFIARRGARSLINHSEVEQLLTQHGYKTVYMEDYAIPVQLGIASEANEIVATHGAAIGLLILRKNIKSLIEIFPPNVYHDYFSVALGDKVNQYIQLISSFDSRVLGNSWGAIWAFKNKAFSADIAQIKKALSLLN
jgi:spore coat protein CotF